MSENWQAGDLALSVFGGFIKCGDGLHLGRESPPKGYIGTVKYIGKSVFLSGQVCECEVLHFADGRRGLASRFRKVTPPKADEFDREVIELMTGRKVPSHA